MNAFNTIRYARDPEVVQRLRPEAPTDWETRAMQGLDELDYEIFTHKMHMIALEGKETTMKLGASTAMRWGDVAFGIYTAQGDLAVCATGIYHHAVLSQLPVKYLIKHLAAEPTVGLKAGDAFFYNDPYYGGVHNADMGLCIPVFVEDRLVCFIGAAVHTGECGGSEPGGMVNGAKSRYDEGLMCPPIKVGENYELKEDLLGMLATMTRDPRTMVLDIKARLAAARIAERRVHEYLEEIGTDFLVGGLRRILKQTGEAARQKIATLNDGIYRQPRFMDTTGPEAALLKINLTIEKKGERIKLILNGSSPMLPDRPVNAYFQGLLGMAMVYACGWLFPELPANNGLLEAVDWEFPDDSFINPKGDVPVSYAPATMVAFSQGMFMAGAKMTYATDPSRAVAAWYTGFAVTVFAGFNQWGEPMADITPEINATGAGGRPGKDGVDVAGAFFATMSDCGDVETTESERPFLYTFRNFFNNSYGHGKFRGGCGVGYGLKVHGVPMVALGSMGFGSHFPSTLGVFGGRAAPPAFIQTVRGSNLDTLMADGGTVLPARLEELYAPGGSVEEGDRAYLSVAHPPALYQGGDTYYAPVSGGAGYGDPLQREPASVARDVAIRRCSKEAARDIYAVEIDEHTGLADAEATKTRRAEVVRKRLERAKPYHAFLAEWSKQAPPADVLRYYGPWDGASAQTA
ncbi:hydantoinase B/oxoprolinase family protein [Martelella soudanensis]|uniref:hydantoinase B/oxoprolinase family protein n=1 Tax=unclassified Martelella TaxID=2629616 RepID=UPI0015DD9799|nr:MULTISPECIES: hydantoinase B/oxoprolinase family protein [unclassified Martelella]